MNDNLVKLSGNIEDVIFRNENNGYTVIELYTKTTISTCVGIMPDVSSGESITVYGNIIEHPVYGPQFSVETYERNLPNTVAQILQYLSNGALKGIGPATATKLVKEFGSSTLDVLENEPERIAKLKGFSIDKAKQISLQLKAKKGFTELLEFLKPYQISTEKITKIFKIYTTESINAIKDNPYILCDDVIDVDFEIVDIIARDFSIPEDSKYRIFSAILYVLNHNKRNGHTCVPLDKLIKVVTSLISIDEEIVKTNVIHMCDEGFTVITTFNNVDFIFTKNLYEAEKYIAENLIQIMKLSGARIIDADHEIKEIEKIQGIQYAKLQKTAIINALNKGLLILTGGPGTGKTTTLNAIISILTKNGQKVLLCAPTGRAAKRMTELTGKESKTIHRLLEANYTINDESVFNKNELNQLNCNALVIDESSMIDASLFSSLIKALPIGCRLILVGDSDQLPSVGPGNILGDLIASNIIPYVELQEIFRQSKGSLIVTNAHNIVKGIYPELNRRDNDFFYIKAKNNKEIEDTIISLYTTRLPEKLGYNSIDDIQIITPTRKTQLGTFELNKSIQNVINPSINEKNEIKVMGFTLRENDKVMQTKNDYDVPWVNINTGECGEGVFNGDIGILKSIDKNSRSLEIQYDDRLAKYEGDQIDNIELAYACTVHKSQGNEFEVVIIPVFRTTPKLLYRNLFYTAVTRAKKMLILVGYEHVIYEMIDNDKKQQRYTGLKEFLLDKHL